MERDRLAVGGILPLVERWNQYAVPREIAPDLLQAPDYPFRLQSQTVTVITEGFPAVGAWTASDVTESAGFAGCF